MKIESNEVDNNPVFLYGVICVLIFYYFQSQLKGPAPFIMSRVLDFPHPPHGKPDP